LNHRVREEQGVLVVALEGDVDLETSPLARRVLLDAVDLRRPVLVDLSGVGYIDSSGVASLVEAFQRARKGDSDFGLVCVTETARRVLELARLDRVFRIFASLEEGLRGRS
jgi:anti-sigma B factor antagonist